MNENEIQEPIPAAVAADEPETVQEPIPAEPEEQISDEDADAAACEMARRIEEAEQRGYLRGRNATIDELMRDPGLYASPSAADRSPAASDSYSILASPRLSIWDRG